MATDNLLHKAIKFAFKAHKGQDRDGEAPLPYVTHVIEVLTKLRYIGEVQEQTVLVAGVLHDVLEETNVTPDEISRRFGAEVLALVDQLTRKEPTSEETFGLTEDEIYALRTNRLLKEIASMGTEAKTVKLADRLSNLENALVTRPLEKQKRYIQQTLLILSAIPRDTNPKLWDSVKKLTEDK